MRKFLKSEIKNFEDIAKKIKPESGEIPNLTGIDIYGETIPLNGLVGGDHIIYVDFKQRYDIDNRIQTSMARGRTDMADKLKKIYHKAGILIADVSGHRITDALLAAMLHQAFLTGVRYELTQNGEVTTELFENLNFRFYNSSSLTKFITMIYGEISEDGTFRFINAGHPNPVIFSAKYDSLMTVNPDMVVNFPPIGTLPSKDDIDSSRTSTQLGYKRRYLINEINLMGAGDILLLYTDGLSEHNHKMEKFYFPADLEKTLIRSKGLRACEIFLEIKHDMLDMAKFSDDFSLVIIKKTGR